MDIHHLVKKANNIAAFFESEPDIARGEKGIADHIRSFWDPRMRREILDHVDVKNGEGLRQSALNAIRSHRQQLTPGK